MAAFYTNETFPLPVVTALRRLGHHVLTSRNAGQANRRIPEAKVRSFAASGIIIRGIILCTAELTSRGGPSEV